MRKVLQTLVAAAALTGAAVVFGVAQVPSATTQVEAAGITPTIQVTPISTDEGGIGGEIIGGGTPVPGLTATYASNAATATAGARSTGTAQANATSTRAAQQTATAAPGMTATAGAIASSTSQAAATSTANAIKTATAAAGATSTAAVNATSTTSAIKTATAIAGATSTAAAGATSTANAIKTATAAPGATSTAGAIKTATAIAGATSTAAVNATGTASAIKTATAAPGATSTAIVRATGTAIAGATSTAAVNATGTANAIKTATAAPGATSTAGAIKTATAIAGATSTASAIKTATAAPGATGTAAAIKTATAAPGATSTARVVQTATAIVVATGTASANQTATAAPGATSTAGAIKTATAIAGATSTAVVRATGTAGAIQTATAAPGATSTARVVQTATAIAGATSTAIVRATGTAVAAQTATAAPGATSTAAVRATGTAIAGATSTAVVRATGTARVIQTATAIVQQTATAVFAATSTAESIATATARATMNPTPAATSSVTADRFEYTCRVGAATDSTTGASCTDGFFGTTYEYRNGQWWTTQTYCMTTAQCKTDEGTPLDQYQELPCVPKLTAGGIVIDCKPSTQLQTWNVNAQVYTECPINEVLRSPYPRTLVSFDTSFILQPKVFNDENGISSAPQSPANIADFLDADGNPTKEGFDAGAWKDLRLIMRSKRFTGGEIWFGDVVPKPKWEFTDRAWNSGKFPAIQEGDQAKYEYETSSDGIGYNYGRAFDQKNKIPANEFNLPAYPVKLTTYCGHEWMVSVKLAKEEWKQTGSCYATRLYPDGSTYVPPGTSNEGCDPGYVAPGELVYGWTDFNTAWAGINLRDIGRLVSYDQRTKTKGGGVFKDRKTNVPKVYWDDPWGLWVPVIEVQSVIRDECVYDGSCEPIAAESQSLNTP